jgi:transposase
MMSLSERTYNCSVCGLFIDKDLNVAYNIKAIGIIKILETNTVGIVGVRTIWGMDR